MKAALIRFVHREPFFLKEGLVSWQQQFLGSRIDERWRSEEMHPIPQLDNSVIGNELIVPTRHVFPEVEVGSNGRRRELTQLRPGQRWDTNPEGALIDVDRELSMLLRSLNLLAHVHLVLLL
jgi:hypothetical protein